MFYPFRLQCLMQIPKPNNEYDLTDKLSICFESDIHELPSYN